MMVGVGDGGDATARQRRVWERMAPRYDRMIASAERRLFAGIREWVGQRAHGRVLEVAVGTGRSLGHYPPDAELVGIDLSPGMLAFARERARNSGRRIELREGDAERLPFASASFDSVVCVLALCSIPRPDVAIAEMARVVRPGGSVILVDHIGSSAAPVFAAQWLVERVTIRTAGEHFTRRQLALVGGAGLDVVEQRRSRLGIVERIHAVRPGPE